MRDGRVHRRKDRRHLQGQGRTDPLQGLPAQTAGRTARVPVLHILEAECPLLGTLLSGGERSEG